MRTLMRWLALVCTVTALSAAPLAVSAPRCAQPPVLDGRLDDACWAAGQWLGPFTVLGTAGQPAACQTWFQLCHDGRTLYLAARLDEPRVADLHPQTLPPERDGKVFGDGCLEVMIDPTGERTEYYHLAVNPAGAIYDSECRQGGHIHVAAWNGNVSVKTGREPGAWTVELALPLADLGLSAASTGEWGLNVARERVVDHLTELSTFSALRGGFHEPALFARLKLVDADLSRFLWTVRPPAAERVVEAAGARRWEARVGLTNATGRTRPARLTARLTTPDGGVGEQQVTVTGDAGRFVELPLAIPAPRLGPAVLTLTVADPVTGEVWHIRRQPLTLSYVPLALRFTRPGYRDAIYATQTLDKLTGELTCGLPAETLGRYRVTVGLAVGERQIRAQVAPVQPVMAFSLPLDDLPVGTYEVTAELRDRDRVLHRATRTLSKLAPSPVEVRLDEQQVTRLNGRPALILGWFSAEPSDFATIAGYGCNAFVDYNAEYRTVADQRKYLDAVVAAGLKCAFYPYPGSAMMSAAAMAKPLAADEAEALRQRVRALKDHPGVLGWYLADEPEGRPELPERLAAIRQVIAAEDPYHPCLMLNDSLDGVRRYREGGDVLMPDPYPLFLKDGFAARDMSWTGQFMRTVAEAAEGWRGRWVTPQAFNYGDYGAVNNRGPNLAEVRNQWYQAVVEQATGCLFYTYSQTANFPVMSLGVPFVVRESRLLEPWILAPASARQVTVTPATAPVQTSLRTIDGQSVLFAVSTATQPLDVALQLPEGLPAVWYVVSEDRQFTAAGGRLVDRFEPYATHVYTTVQAQSNALSLAAVTRAISQADVARRKPGNLAFEAEGTTIEVSSQSTYGSTPTRLTDGILGGMQWRSGQAGRLPEWATVKFRQPTQCGRVVVYSQSITAATLQVPAGAGWRDVAKFERSEAQTMTARCAPVETTALRVLVTACAEPYVTMTEVEAYRD